MVTSIFPGLRRPLLFAHRGASAQAPENTMPAFELAVRLGAPALELDAHLSADGEVVVIHDATLERTTDGCGEVRAHTYRDLVNLDAGYHFTRAGAPLFRGLGVHLPRLGELFEAFPGVGFNIELKQRAPSMVRPVLELLARHGVERALLAAGDDAIMAELEAARPGCALGLSVGQVKAALRRHWRGASLAPFAGRALQVPPRHPRYLAGLVPVVTRGLVRRARADGLEVHLWTINDPARAARWLAAGVDGIMSDDPGALLPLFAQR